MNKSCFLWAYQLPNLDLAEMTSNNIQLYAKTLSFPHGKTEMDTLPRTLEKCYKRILLPSRHQTLSWVYVLERNKMLRSGSNGIQRVHINARLLKRLNWSSFISLRDKVLVFHITLTNNIYGTIFSKEKKNSERERYSCSKTIITAHKQTLSNKLKMLHVVEKNNNNQIKTSQ